MPKKLPKPQGIRVVNYALIDESGRTWDFDFTVGWESDVAAVVRDVRPGRVLVGHYADTADLSEEALARLGELNDVQAGVYRSNGESIVYVSRD